MMISIDHSAAASPYEQVKRQLSAQITSGELTAGSKLPTVRALAEQLDLAPNTVAKAYRELEAAGLKDTDGNGVVNYTSGPLSGKDVEITLLVSGDYSTDKNLAEGVIVGLGAHGYRLALEAALERLGAKPPPAAG